MTAHDPEPWDWDLDLEPSGAWEIKDDAEANWALRKIDRAQREIDRIQANARRELLRITENMNAAVKPSTDTISFMKAHLIDYRRRMEQDDPELPKTYRLPAGVLSRRKGPSRYVVTNEQAFIEWAEANDPDLYKRTPLVSGLKDYTLADGVIVSRDGEPVPGVVRETDSDVYDVKPT